jgi:phage terminase small subunit
MARKLNDRQMRFVEEYLVDLNATQAAIRAGYTSNYANTNVSKLLQNTSIAEQIAKRQAARVRRTEITQDMVVRELALIAFSNAADYAHVVEKRATALVDGETIALFDENGEPLMYKTVDPVLTDELTDDQKKALSVIKKGRDGFEIKPYDKLRALELLGRHLGMWDKKEDTGGDDVQNDGFLDALRGETQSVWEED